MMTKRIILSLLVGTVGAYAFGDALAQENRNRIMLLQQQVAEQKERIDGLTSLVEGLSATLAQMQDAKPQDEVLQKRLERLEAKVNTIETGYVTKDALAQQRKYTASKNTPKAQKQTPSTDKRLTSKPVSKLYSEGVRLFVKKAYDEAAKHFMLTAQKGYKPAASNYYLGEIAYYTKKYNDAIFYYKKSAGLYDKAGYMDVLLLHTAISLERTGKKKQAKLFYENVIESYPGKKAASIARRKLKKL
jgi:TolA-binding protein